MENKNESTSQTESHTVPRSSSQVFTARNFLLALATVLKLSVAYYFVIALPNHNRSMLQLERERFQKGIETKEKEEQEKKNKEEAAKAEATQKKLMLQYCLNTAEQDYWQYIKLNGTEVPGKRGV
jgi:hypothetical protein